jgi:hypothetical protein
MTLANTQRCERGFHAVQIQTECKMDYADASYDNLAALAFWVVGLHERK